VQGEVVIIGGTTTATEGIATSNGLQENHLGNGRMPAGFVGVLSADLRTRHWGTYLGGEGGQVNVNGVDSDGVRIYVGGMTQAWGVPRGFVRTGQQGVYGGGVSDRFVVRVRVDSSMINRQQRGKW
jgi:hypothetical protein